MKYSVKATDPKGREQEFAVDATDEKSAAAFIRARGFFPFDVRHFREPPEPMPPAKPDPPPAQKLPPKVAAQPAGEPDGSVVCLACGSHAVQLLSVTERDIGAALFADILVGTAVGVTAGRKNLILNTCMKCGTQWAPGASETLDQIKKRQEKEELPLQIGCMVIVIIFMVLFFIGKLTN